MSLAGNNHGGGPSGLEANCEETGLDAAALATMLQTCLHPRPFKTAGWWPNPWSGPAGAILTRRGPLASSSSSELHPKILNVCQT